MPIVLEWTWYVKCHIRDLKSKSSKSSVGVSPSILNERTSEYFSRSQQCAFVKTGDKSRRTSVFSLLQFFWQFFSRIDYLKISILLELERSTAQERFCLVKERSGLEIWLPSIWLHRLRRCEAIYFEKSMNWECSCYGLRLPRILDEH